MVDEFSKERLHEISEDSPELDQFERRLAQLLPAGFTTDPIADESVPVRDGEREFTDRERDFLKLLIARGTGNDGWYIDEEIETRKSILTDAASILSYNPASRSLLRSVISGLEEDRYVRVKKEGDRQNSPIVNFGLEDKGQQLLEEQQKTASQNEELDKETLEKLSVSKDDFNIDDIKLDGRIWQIAPVIIRRIEVLNEGITSIKNGNLPTTSLRELTVSEIKEKAEAFRELFAERPHSEEEFVSFLAKIVTKHNILQERYRRLSASRVN